LEELLVPGAGQLSLALGYRGGCGRGGGVGTIPTPRPTI